MKKQIITITSYALVALILFTTYFVFFRDDGIEDLGDPFYTLTDDVKKALLSVDTDVTVTLNGYDGDDEGWEMIYRFAEVITEENGAISLETASGGKNVVVSASTARL